MANAFYTTYKNALLTNAAGVDWTSDTIKALLCSSGYTANMTTDDFLVDIPTGSSNRLATAGTVATITVSGGAVLVSGTVTYTAVTTGHVGTQVILYKDTGNSTTSRLLARLDDATTGLPVTTDGGNIVLQFDVAGILQL